MMTDMLTVETFRPVECSVEITVDAYLPLAATTSLRPLAVSYFTVGNGVTSLVEIKIERGSRLVREIVLVSLENIEDVSPRENAQVIEGLPVISQESVPEYRTHLERAIKVSNSSDAFTIDWSDGTPLDFIARHQRLSFLVGQNKLLGARVTHLSRREIEQLREHARPRRSLTERPQRDT